MNVLMTWTIAMTMLHATMMTVHILALVILDTQEMARIVKVCINS